MASASPTPKLLQFRTLPTPLRPLARAYLLGYASAVGPRLLTLILQHMSRTLRKRELSSHPEKRRTFLQSAARILRIGLELHRFPAFCAALVGGTSLLLDPLRTILKESGLKFTAITHLRLARWISTFIAAWFSLQLLHSGQTAPSTSSTSPDTERHESTSVPEKKKDASLIAGRTLDLTLFSVTRAVDVLVGEWWSRRSTRRQASGQWTRFESLTSRLTDPAVFASSCAFIMWSWFYYPEALPPSYNKWITSAAAVDARLIEALRRCHEGTLVYGKDTGQAPLLEGMCEDLNMPRKWGNPAVSVPFPCDLVHMGCGSSCEYHMLSRFVRSWRWSMSTYLPLALALQLRKGKRPILTAFLSAARSSAFLGTFIALFYYGVCLGRTRLGPRLIGKDLASRQRIDGGKEGHGVVCGAKSFGYGGAEDVFRGEAMEGKGRIRGQYSSGVHVRHGEPSTS
ncbi:integral membrane protein [Sarocladium implicatum]|nr:integral membrane protein [Sarocladium implicatum]